MNSRMLSDLLTGIAHLTWQNGVMIGLGVLLVWLAIRKGFEPLLLLPIGTGCVWANLPQSAFLGGWDGSVLTERGGMLSVLYDVGVATVQVGAGDQGDLAHNADPVVGHRVVDQRRCDHLKVGQGRHGQTLDRGECG